MPRLWRGREYVIEGEILPNVRIAEDAQSGNGKAMPEFPGYCGPSDPQTPVMRVTAVTHRLHPIMQTTIGPSEEHVNLAGIPTEASILGLVERAMPGRVRNVYAASCGGGKFMAVLQFRKATIADEGRQRQAALLAFSAWPELLDMSSYVDDDVDPFDMSDVLWAMTTRYQGNLDTVFLPGVRGHVLDPTQSPLYDARIPARRGAAARPSSTAPCLLTRKNASKGLLLWKSTPGNSSHILSLTDASSARAGRLRRNRSRGASLNYRACQRSRQQDNTMKKRLVVGLRRRQRRECCASRCLRPCGGRRKDWEVHLVTSGAGERVLHEETGMSGTDLAGLAFRTHDIGNIGAAIASGTFETEGMAVVPCSMKTLAGICHGYAENLLLRAADVTLKERRKLVLVARETPLGLVHLRNMTALAEMGVTILPPMLTYYQHPQSIEDMTTHIVGKIMREFRLEAPGFRRWKDHDRRRDTDPAGARQGNRPERPARQGGDCLVSVTGGDAPHIGAAALCADGEIRRLDRNGHREGELAAELAERAASELGCCVCAVCGIHFDGISRAEIASVVAAVRDMADTWGSARPPITEGRPSPCSFDKTGCSP